ncbi:MAG TPA: chitobiase/beta-hexosaminidase C-terminal domain-containing protein, partial [Catalimonadaceae bacterium]|nr:chitobiase/beta-hexosaminidase C-terminal domain-containing protein [Catalimonadaceae bacterium]
YTNVPNSAIVTANYVITNPGIVATPVISPVTGTYQGMQSVTITCSTSGASVYYTTNGNLPDVVNPNSYTKLYTGAFSINASATIRAIGVKSGIQNSGYAVSYITILNPSATVATPVISPGTGSYAGPQSVTITSGTQGATIYYTTTGNVPVVGTSFTKMYTGSFTISSTSTIRAMATLTGSVNSGVSVAYLTIGPGRKSVDEINESIFTAQAFPNPFRDRLQIVVSSGEQEVHFTLTDVQGKRVENYSIQSASGNQFELLAPGIPSGLYILRASSGMNSKSMMIRKD